MDGKQIQTWLEQFEVSNLIALVALIAVISLILVMRRKLRNLHDIADQAREMAEDRHRNALEQRTEFVESLNLLKRDQHSVNEKLDNGVKHLRERIDQINDNDALLKKLDSQMNDAAETLRDVDMLQRHLADLRETVSELEASLMDRLLENEREVSELDSAVTRKLASVRQELDKHDQSLREFGRMRSDMAQSFEATAKKLQSPAATGLNGRGAGSSLVVRKDDQE